MGVALSRLSWKSVIIAACLACASLVTPMAAKGGGISTPEVFPRFDPDAPVCHAPVGLEPELAYVQENDREFLEGVNLGLSMAARDRGLKYERVLAESDAALAAQEIQTFLGAKTGALVATSSNPDVVRPSLEQFLLSGGFVGTIVPPPATLLLNAPQYATGKALADRAVDYINRRLGGKATVVLLTQDSMQYLAPRFSAMRDALNQMPGVTIVADITPVPVSKEGGRKTMEDILIAFGDVDVILGADAVVLGALEALRAAGKARPDQFLGGIDGEPEAVAEIKSSDSPFKASVALSSPVFGYAMGYYAADWLEGKSIPKAMDILPIALTKDNIAAYEADLVNPAAAFQDPARRDDYLSMYGNICFDTRDQYVDFPWSSEAVR